MADAYDPARCPRCAGDLAPEMETRGASYLTYEVCIGGWCPNGVCDYSFTWRCS